MMIKKICRCIFSFKECWEAQAYGLDMILISYLGHSILISHHVYIVFNFLCKMTILQPFGCHVFLVE